jgi:capsule polysaccharide export protein KpsE/RkpR
MPDPELTPAMTHPTVTGLRLLRLRWWLIALCSVVGALGAAAYYTWAPRSYEAELLIVPKRSSSDLMPGRSVLSSLPFDLGDASPFGQSDADRIAAILESRSVTDAVITRFDLVERYHAARIERARKALWKHCETKVEKKPNVVRITCQDNEPEVARDMTNAFGKEADAVFRRIAISSATEERAFLEKRVAEAKHNMEASAAVLRQFQESHKIIDLPEQGKAVVSGIAALEGSLISKQLELAYARGFSAADETSVTQLRRQIAILTAEQQAREAKRSGETGARSPRSGSELFPPAMEIPGLGAELESLLREHKIDETVFLMLTERYESRRLDEARDLSTFVVVDDAALPTYRVWPTFLVIPAGVFAGMVLGMLLITLPVWWKDLRRRAALDDQSVPA